MKTQLEHMPHRGHPGRTGLRRGLAIASLALCLGAQPGCGEAPQATAPGITAPPVLVARVVVRDVIDRIEATGQLVAKAEATIAAQVNGQVTAIAVEEGDAVAHDQVMLEIDPQRRELELADAEAHLAEAVAQLAESERAWQRVNQLSKSNAASQARVDEAQTARSLARSRESGARARLGLARRALADSTLRAPFAGLVARRHVNVGEYLTSGLPLFHVVALDPIEVDFALAEIDSARVVIGQEVLVSVAPYPGELFVAHVSVISPTLDSSTRTLRVKALLPNPGERLRPGLFVRADLGVSQRSGVTLVPEEALLQRADGSVLFCLDGDDRVRRVSVTTGVRQQGFVEIRGDVGPQDRVVVRGHADLIDGSVVTLRTREGRPSGAGDVAAPASDGSAP